jgi:hypothetical protein
MLTLTELLEMKGLDCSRAKSIKLVRHKDKRVDVEALLRGGHIGIYQSIQGSPIFNCDYVVSFMGMDGTKARLLGVFRVGGHRQVRPADIADLPCRHLVGTTDVIYDLEEVPGFEDFKDRLVIDWGGNAISWHQWLTDKRVVEILPEGRGKPFPGYLDFVLTYDDLKIICENPSSNKDWHRALAAVAGIYIIVEEISGPQYIGSAYGKDGILGRWMTYARTGHGGNAELKKILAEGRCAKENLRFAILRTLPKTLTMTEVVEHESQHKEKLGTRAFGLNLN